MDGDLNAPVICTNMLSFDLILKDSQISKEVEYFLALTGRKHWDDVIKNIENTYGYFLKQYLYIKNPLASAIHYYNTLLKKGASIRKNINSEIYYLASKAFLFNFLYRNLNDKAKNILIGRIKSDDNRSFLFELEIINHFFRNKAQIEFVEYENPDESNPIYDFLIQMDNKVFEIECKYKEYDSKRKLTRPAMYLLTDLILKEINIEEFNCFVSFEFKNTLSKNFNNQKETIEILLRKLQSGNWGKSEYEGFYLEIFPIEFEATLDTSEKLFNFIKPYYREKSHLVSLCTTRSNFIVRYLTLAKESLVGGIYESLKKAPSQFSKTRAGIIACYIEGIYPEDWVHLKDEGGLFNMTGHFLFKEENNYIHSVLYTSKSEPTFNKSIYDNKKQILSFKNPYARFYNEYESKELININ